MSSHSSHRFSCSQSHSIRFQWIFDPKLYYYFAWENIFSHSYCLSVFVCVWHVCVSIFGFSYSIAAGQNIWRQKKSRNDTLFYGRERTKKHEKGPCICLQIILVLMSHRYHYSLVCLRRRFEDVGVPSPYRKKNHSICHVIYIEIERQKE